MLSTAELMDAAKVAHGGVSDYRLAKLIGVTQTTLSAYRIGRAFPSNPVTARLAALAGLDPEAAVCWVNLERTANDAERQTWLSILHRVERSPRSEMAAA